MKIKNYAINKNGRIQRHVFANWVLEMHENEPEFHRKIFMSNQADFDLRGYANEQNFRICGS